MNALVSHCSAGRLFFAALALPGCGMTGGETEQRFVTATTINEQGVIAVDVAGMEPQVAIIRHDAAEQGWQIVCEGRAGEERVLRLTAPPGASEAAMRAYFTPQNHIGSSSRFYYQGDPPSKRCDKEPTTSGGDPSRVLSIGPREPLTRLASIARRCGFTGAAVRERRHDDVPAGAGQLQDDWLTLDAGEDITPRYGPSICFVQMQSRAFPSPQQ